MVDCVLVGVGGFIGAVLRYLIGLIPLKTGVFPIKTLAINIIGAFAIGIISALAMKSSSLNTRLILFLRVGICGGFTTFSSFALETGSLMQRGNTRFALLYAVLSVVFGVIAVLLGEAAVR